MAQNYTAITRVQKLWQVQRLQIFQVFSNTTNHLLIILQVLWWLRSLKLAGILHLSFLCYSLSWLLSRMPWLWCWDNHSGRIAGETRCTWSVTTIRPTSTPSSLLWNTPTIFWPVTAMPTTNGTECRPLTDCVFFFWYSPPLLSSTSWLPSWAILSPK